ncbi:MAG: HAMP domain-containing sensor histidine kinase [Polyangiaceae bacterium]
MTPRGPWLALRLLGLQLAAITAAALLVTVFAPRLLLLESASFGVSPALVATLGASLAIFVVCATLLFTWRLRPMLRAVDEGSDVIEPGDVVSLYMLPVRLTVTDTVGMVAITAITLVPGIRPPATDVATWAEVLLLAYTIGSVLMLPAYVLMRAAVTQVLEQLPVEITSAAVDHPTRRAQKVPRLQLRVLIAASVPVAFVALGASLLVVAHVRASNAEVRERQALELARGIFDSMDDDASGRVEAMAAAQKRGYSVQIEPEEARFSVVREETGTSLMRVPLDHGHALLRFPTSPLSALAAIYVVVSLLAVAIAALLGSRLGGDYATDIALVTRELRTMGADDIVRGTRVQRAARFVSVHRLIQTIDGLGGIFREFGSAQERAIEARTATERMRGLFLASMSHDLKAPLNAILGFAELASRGKLTAGQSENLVIIEQRGRELLHLVQTILDAARVDAGELRIEPEPTDSAELVFGAISEARELVNEADVTISAELADRLPILNVDPVRATQALTAVILSAVRFAEQDTVRVRASRSVDASRVCIEVETPGKGLPDAEVTRVFEAFKDPERARKHGSLGLGLSLARAIVEQHGGAVEATAVEHHGTTFRIWLPTLRSGSIPAF